MKKTTASSLALTLLLCLSACGDGGGGGGGGGGGSDTSANPASAITPDTLMFAEGETRYDFGSYIPWINEYTSFKTTATVLYQTQLLLRNLAYTDYPSNSYYLTATGLYTRANVQPLNIALPKQNVLADDGATARISPVLTNGAKDTLTVLVKYERIDVSGQKIASYLLPSLLPETLNSSANSKAFITSLQSSSALFPAGSTAFKWLTNVYETEYVYFDPNTYSSYTSFDQVPSIAANAPLSKTLGGYAIRYHSTNTKAYVLYNGKVYDANYRAVKSETKPDIASYTFNPVAGKAVAAEITALCWDTTKFPTDKGCTALPTN